MNLTSFQRAYIACALWSSTDETTEQGGEPMDRNYTIDDIAPEALDKMVSDCTEFFAANSIYLAQAGEDAQNGHDFWLTRNGHGAGFWDRGYLEPIGNHLTEASEAFGTCDLYVGDDNRIYVS